MFLRKVALRGHSGLPMYQIHSSGHMMPTELLETIATVTPKTLVPIDTEQPELYGSFVKDLTRVEQVRKESSLII
jgi:mRNA degradation ribonuclease J1/J2